jgi:hypothetical protein
MLGYGENGAIQTSRPFRLGRAMRCGVMTMVAMVVTGCGKGGGRNQHQQTGNGELLHGLILAQQESTP